MAVNAADSNPQNSEDLGIAVAEYVRQNGGPAAGYSVALDPESGVPVVERWELPFPQPTDAELEAALLAVKKQQKIDEFHARAFDDLRPYFTQPHGPDETLYVLAKHIEAILAASGQSITDQRLKKIIEVGDKAMAKKQAIEQASTLSELEGISWTP